MGWLVAFVLAILLYDKSNIVKRQYKEIQELKNKIKNLNTQVEQLDVTKTDNVSYVEQRIFSEDLKKNSEKITKQNENVKKEKILSSEDRKNTNIMLTGSILVVLSAIVFLTSTWHTIPNEVKTLGLVLFIGIFLGCSKIAKEKFNLEKTSRTFFYIAMAYIPICLIGISFFGLFGEYFSIRGEGINIYLALVSIFLALLYYGISKRIRSKELFIGSIISQYSAVIAFFTIIETNLTLISAALMLYNVLVMLLTKDNISKWATKVVLYTVSAVFLLYMFTLNISEGYGFYEIITLLLVIVNYCIILRKNNTKLDFGLLNFFILVFGNSIINNKSWGINGDNRAILSLVWYGLYYGLINFYIKEKNKLEIAYGITCIWGLSFLPNIDNSFITLYMLGFIESVILTIAYKRNLFENFDLKNIIFILYLLTGCSFIYNYDMDVLVYVIWFIVMGLVSLKFNEILIYIVYGFAYIALMETTAICGIAFDLLITGVLFYLDYFKKKNTNYSILALVGNFLVLYKFEGNILMLILGAILTIMSLYKLEKKNEITIGAFVYLLYFGTNIKINLVMYSILLIWSILHLLVREDNKKVFRILTYITLGLTYYEILVLLGIEKYVFLLMIYVEFISILAFKKVLENEKNIDDIKYVFYGLIYLVCLTAYNNITDGILTVVILILSLFYAYGNKDATKVLINLIAITINSFALTKAFWLSIPWWIYLLLVGLVLIAFAIRNEAKEKSEKLTASLAIKKFKDKIEKG